MVGGHQVASSEPLQLPSSMNEEMLVRDCRLEALPVLRPDQKSREASLPVDGQHIEVSMEGGHHITFLDFFQVDPWRRGDQLAFFHGFSDGVFL